MSNRYVNLELDGDTADIVQKEADEQGRAFRRQCAQIIKEHAERICKESGNQNDHNQPAPASAA